MNDVQREEWISYILQMLKYLDARKLRNVYHFVLHLK